MTSLPYRSMCSDCPRMRGKNPRKIPRQRPFVLARSRQAPSPRSPLSDCDCLDACTGSCLELIGIPENDLSFHAAPRAAWPARGVRRRAKLGNALSPVITVAAIAAAFGVMMFLNVGTCRSAPRSVSFGRTLVVAGCGG
jgi:hypothetical protein